MQVVRGMVRIFSGIAHSLTYHNNNYPNEEAIMGNTNIFASFLDLLLLPLYPEVRLKCDNYSFSELNLL